MNSPSTLNIALKGRSHSLDKWVERTRSYRLEGSIFLFLLVINLLFFLVFLGPALRYQSTSEASIQSARSSISELLNYKNAQENLNQLEKTFLSQQDLAKLTDRLPTMAKRHRLVLPGVSYETGRQKEGELRKVASNFTLSGRYREIRKFIQDVENMDQFLYIDGLVLESLSGQPGRLELKMKMVATLQ